MGRRSLRAKIVKQPNFAQKWVKSGVAGSGPKEGPKWVSGPFLFTKSTPQPTWDPLLGHFQPTTTTPLGGPVLRESPRDYLSDTPLSRAMGFLLSQHGQLPLLLLLLLGAIPPSPFSESFPLGKHAKWRCDTTPLKRGISAILARYSLKTRQMGAIPPSAILSQMGIARYGGVSRTGPLRTNPLLTHFCAKLIV